MDTLSEERENQIENGTFSVRKLALALIHEASKETGLTPASFAILKDLFLDCKVLRSSDFHSLTVSIWSDANSLSGQQMMDFADFLMVQEFEGISEENAYSLCDMIAASFNGRKSVEILGEYSKVPTLKDAAEYSLSTL